MMERYEQDVATLKAAYYAERRASDACQGRGAGIACAGVLAAVVLHTVSLPLAVVLSIGGLALGLFYCWRSFVHIARSQRCRRALARADGGGVHWYTGWTTPREETARMKALWRNHPVLMALGLTVSVAPWIVLLIARFHAWH